MSKSDALAKLSKQPGDAAAGWLTDARHREAVSIYFDDMAAGDAAAMQAAAAADGKAVAADGKAAAAQATADGAVVDAAAAQGAAEDADTKATRAQESADLKLPLAGGTLTGDLVVQGDGSGSSLRVTGEIAVTGNLSATGTARIGTADLKGGVNNSIVLGNGAGGRFTPGDFAIAIGNQSQFEVAGGARSVAIGNRTQRSQSGQSAIAIGDQAQDWASAAGAIAIGASSQERASATGAISIGGSAQRFAAKQNSIAVGGSAQYGASGESSLAVGTRSQFLSSGADAIALGTRSQEFASGVSSIAIGKEAAGRRNPSIATSGTVHDLAAAPLLAGVVYEFGGSGVVVVGGANAGPVVNSTLYTATGDETAITATSGLVIRPVTRNGDNSVCIGTAAIATVDDGIAIGRNTRADDPAIVKIGTPGVASRLQIGSVEFLSIPALKAAAASSATYDDFRAAIQAL